MVIQSATAKILMLFSELKNEYGNLFEHQKHRFDTARAREWAVEILESGINEEQYQHGRYQAVKNQKYPTERAYEFIQLCKNLGFNDYPDIDKAYMDAAEGNYNHKVVLETAKRVGEWNLKTEPRSFSYALWIKHYKNVCIEHSQSDNFDKPLLL